MQAPQASVAAKRKPAAKKKVMGMRSTQPRMQGPISGGAGGGFAQQPGPGMSGGRLPILPGMNPNAYADGPAGGKPFQGGGFAPPGRGPMPLPPSAAPRPGMPPMGNYPRPGAGGGFAPPGLPPAGGPGMGGDIASGDMGLPPQGFNPQQFQVQRAAGVFDKPTGPGAGEDQRAQMMQQLQASQARMGQMQKPPGMMGSVAPQPGPGGGMGPGGFDRNAMMQQMQGGMANANMQRDQWRQANPNPVMNQMPAGRPAPNIQALQQAMAGRGGQPQF